MHWPLGGWCTRVLIVHQQWCRHSDSKKNVPITLCREAYSLQCELNRIVLLSSFLWWTVSFRSIVFNETFNNISAISWRAVFLVDETGVPGINHRSVARHWQTLSHSLISSTPCHEQSEMGSTWIYCWFIYIGIVVSKAIPQSRYC